MGIPQFNFVNSNFFSSFTGQNSSGYVATSYSGPSIITQRIANAVAADRGEVLAITPPAPNASWQYEFWAPGILCQNMSEADKNTVARNYVESQPGVVYYAWKSSAHLRNKSLPYQTTANTGSAARPTFRPETFLYDPQDTVARLNLVARPEQYNRVPSTEHEIAFYAQTMTMITCELHNASYAVDFNFLNGKQSITAARASKLAESPMQTSLMFHFPTGHEGWNCSEQEPVQERARLGCFAQRDAETASYQAIADAFNNLLTGELHAETPSANILRTPLFETDELAFLGGYMNNSMSRSMNDGLSLENSEAFANSDLPSRESRGPLARVAERLFESIVISMLSEPLLQ